MLRSSSSSSTAVYDGTPPHSETSDHSDSSDVDYTPVKFIPPRAKSCAFILTPSIDVARLIKTYLESVRPTDNGDLHAGAQYNGQYTMPQYRGYWNDDDFMTFSPLGPPYIQPGYPGSYVSTTEDLNTFSSHIVDLDTLESNFMTTTMHQLLYLAILFDFMAFTAQTFRRVLGSKPSSAANLKAIRDLMLENLSTMDATFDDDLYSLTITQSKALVLEIEPTPPLLGTSDSWRGAAQRRVSTGLMSPPPTRDDITPSKFTRYETTDASDTTPTTTASPSDIGSLDPSTASGTTPSTVTIAPDGHHANLVVVQTETLLRLSDAPITVFDSGRSISGTSNITNLTDVTDCGPLSVQGAFGPSTQPKKRGLLTPLGLDAILLPGMGNQTLVSLSQYCAGGTSDVQNVGVFTKSGFRKFSLNSALPALKLLSEHGHEVTRGTVKEGIYVQESA
jgi:hypothetical protein